MKFLLLIVVMMMVMTDAVRAAEDAGADMLKTLKKEHPRVILTPERLAEIKKQIQTDETAKRGLGELLKRGEGILKDGPVKYEIVGPRLLTQSRNCLHRVTTTAMLYLLTDDKRWLDRAVLEMTTAAGFKDWNPSHFLDTAEMTAALGLGYDWLYASLTAEQRKTIREAIVSHGLNEGMICYEGKAKYGWWTKATHNWAQVCNGGLTVGALAIADEEPELAGKILENGLKFVRPAYSHWDKDGAWDEGPGYWAYTTQYTAYQMAALKTALGSTFDLAKGNGLHNAGQFRMHFVGPSGRTFNFADANDGAGTPSQMFFLAREFDRPEYAWHHRKERLDSAFDLIWLDTRGESPDKSNVPTCKVFSEADVFFLRSSWSDPKGLWVAAKGGDNGANHSHLDLGCFVLDGLGERFVVDIGPDDYNLPGYFGKERWTYYRLGTKGQNTICIDGANQPAKAKAKVVGFAESEKEARAVIGVSAAYPMTSLTLRGVALTEGADGARSMVLIQDEVIAKTAVEFESAFHTEAAVVVAADGRSATLKVKDKVMNVVLLGDKGAKLVAEEVKLDAPQKPIKGVTKVSVKYGEKVKEVRVGLVFGANVKELPKLEALAKWKGMAPAK